jgi:hypothetical protein
VIRHVETYSSVHQPEASLSTRKTMRAVSTKGQDLAGQDAELTAAGCAKVFREKASGAKTDRAELAKLIRLGGSTRATC